MKHQVQQTLKYSHREEDIASIGQVLDLIREGDIPGATKVLLAYRERLIQSQTPLTVDYDPREDYTRAMQR